MKKTTSTTSTHARTRAPRSARRGGRGKDGGGRRRADGVIRVAAATPPEAAVGGDGVSEEGHLPSSRLAETVVAEPNAEVGRKRPRKGFCQAACKVAFSLGRRGGG